MEILPKIIAVYKRDNSSDMELSEIRNYCLSLPGVTEDIKWGDHLCFSVGGKMFLVTSPDNYPVTASIKTTDEDFNELTNREGIIPAPYMARNKWVHLDNIARFSDKEWIKLLDIAYNLKLSQLSKKAKTKIQEVSAGLKEN